jgi:hypothetical protein
MNNPIKEIGSKLVEDSMLNEEFSFNRGLINELFPYIYEASKRMSSRGISRWLEANGTKLSVATIAKALRNPQPYWQEIYEDNQPAALIFARAHDVEPDEVLKNHELFFHLEGETPVIEGLKRETQRDLLNEYEGACAKLKQDWFSMSPTIIETCLSNVTDDETASVEGVQEMKKEKA